MSDPRLARNAAWMLAARALRTITAAGYFVLVARALGATGYGAFASVCAMLGIFSPFVSLGAGNLLIREVARDRSCFAERWGEGLVITAVSACLLIAATSAVAILVLPGSIPLLLVVVLAIAELLFARLLDLAGMAFQAIEELPMTALLTTVLSVSRVVAAAWMYFFHQRQNVVAWGFLYLLSTLIPAITATWLASSRIARPRWRRLRHPKETLEGVYFSLSLSAQTIYNDIDKTMLARLSSLDAAGIYTAAYRVIDAAFSPISAVFAATYPKFFQRGRNGLASTSTLARRLTVRLGAYPLICGVAIYFSAGWLPRCFGSQFEDSASAVKALAPLLLLRILHGFAADALTGAGFQGIRTSVQIAVALLNVAANVFVLPRYSWRGAVWTSLGCDGAMAVSLWVAVVLLKRKADCLSSKSAPANVSLASL